MSQWQLRSTEHKLGVFPTLPKGHIALKAAAVPANGAVTLSRKIDNNASSYTLRQATCTVYVERIGATLYAYYYHDGQMKVLHGASECKRPKKTGQPQTDTERLTKWLTAHGFPNLTYRVPDSENVRSFGVVLRDRPQAAGY